MLSWTIIVYRQANGGELPPLWGSETGQQIAVWQTDVNGRKWIDWLVGMGRAAADPRGDGYPDRYTAKARYLVRRIIDGPPEAIEAWGEGPEIIIGRRNVGKTMINREVADDCRPDEWLLVEAWDES